MIYKYQKYNKEKTYEEKLEEAQNYALLHSLEIKDGYLYAFRNHDQWGRGVFNRTIFYKKGKYYRDWKLDMRKKVENSFGLGIFPEGNTKVKVLIKDWGVAVNRADGKCRVWGFEVV